mgnify:CR=1 FL=1
MLCGWGVGYRVRVSARVDSYVVSMRGEYVIWDMKDCDDTKTGIELLKCLEKGEQSAREEGWITADDVEAILGVNE